MKPSSSGTRPGGQSRCIAQRSFQAVPDPSCLRVGTGMNAWIVGRTVGGFLFSPVLRRVNMAAGAGGTFHQCDVDDRHFSP